MRDSSEDRSLLALGHVFVAYAGAPYEQALVSGQVVLHNTLPNNCERLRFYLEPVSHCCTFPLSPDYVPRLVSCESDAIDFRLTSLERRISARFSVEYQTKDQPRIHRQELPIALEPESLAGLRARRIFVSYARADYPRIQPSLARVRICGSVWIDKSQVQPSDWFAQRIRSAVRCADVFLVFLSETSTRSPWVEDEIKLALSQRGHGERLAIVAASLEPCAVPSALIGSPFVFIGSPYESDVLVKTLKDTFGTLEKEMTD